MEQFEKWAEKLMTSLNKNQNDKSLMADLRCGFSETKQHRYRPYLANYCNLKKDWNRIPVQTVCEGFAAHPEAIDRGRIGYTIKEIIKGKDTKSSLTSFDIRFRRLLMCDSVQELCGHITGVIRADKSTCIPINYKQLYKNNCSWEFYSARIKFQWASDFWTIREINDEIP